MAKMKYTAAALISVALIGSLAVNQVAELMQTPSLKNTILGSASTKTINITDDDEAAELASDEIADLVVKAGLPEGEYTKEEIEALIEEKSSPEESYVYLTSGQLYVHNGPSDEADVIGQLDATDGVEVLESTEGWYKIKFNDESGYVHADQITKSKAQAEFGAKYYDNYPKAKVTSNGSAVNVRKGASTESEIITQLDPDDEVVLLYNDADFVKICYNSSYDVGYMTDACLELTGEFISHDEVQTKQAQVAAEREAARQAELEKAKAEKSKSGSKKSGASSSPSTTVPGSGQALVDMAARYLGTPYVYGGARPGAFDCSGLVQYCLKQLGYSIARTAASQSAYGTSVSLADAKPGDLLFFANSGGIHHVGIYAGNGQMIHAPSTGDVVRYASINTSYRQRELCAIKRIFK